MSRQAPDWMNDATKGVWASARAAFVRDVGVEPGLGDEVQIECYVVAVMGFRKAAEAIQNSGMLLKTEKGSEYINPAVGPQESAQKAMERYAKYIASRRQQEEERRPEGESADVVGPGALDRILEALGPRLEAAAAEARAYRPGLKAAADEQERIEA